MSFNKEYLSTENIEVALKLSGLHYQKENLKMELCNNLAIMPDCMLEEIFCLLGINWENAILDYQTLSRAKIELIKVLQD